jgi:hypothetical protein
MNDPLSRKPKHRRKRAVYNLKAIAHSKRYNDSHKWLALYLPINDELFERVQNIVVWERRHPHDVGRTLLFLGLGVYERMAVQLGASLPPDCPTPSPHVNRLVESTIGQHLINAEASRWVQRNKRIEVDYRKMRLEGRKLRKKQREQDDAFLGYGDEPEEVEA